MSFSDLLTNGFLFFLVKSTVSLQEMIINKTVIPLTPAFAIIEYKIQEAIFQMAILALQYRSSITNGSYRAFGSTYV